MDRKRVALLIQAVGGDGDRRGAPFRRHAVQLKTFMVERRQDGVAAARNTTQRSAFDDLGHVHGRPDWKADHSRQSGKDRRVASAPGNDDIDALCKRPLECAHAHLADDVRGGVDFLIAQRRHVVDRDHAIRFQRGLEDVSIDIGTQRSHAETQSLLAGNFAHQRQRLFEMRLGAGRSGRPDYERDFVLECAQQHFLQVALGRGWRGRHLTAAKIIGADVD